MALNIFYGIDSNIIVYGLLFVIFFALIQLFLSRTLKDKGTSSIIAFCISLLAVYGISRTGFNVSGIFYNIGINTGTMDKLLQTVIPILIVIGLIFIFWKVKIRFIFVVLGIIFIVGSKFVYAKTLIMVLGIISLITGFYLMWRESRRSVRRGIYLRR